MPIGLSFSPYSSRITLLIQYQSPFLKSLTFIFSSDMATNNKGEWLTRPRLIPPFTSGAIEGRVRRHLPLSGFGQGPVDVVHRSTKVPAHGRIFQFADCEITQQTLPPCQEIPSGRRLPRHPCPYPPDKSLDHDFHCHVF